MASTDSYRIESSESAAVGMDPGRLARAGDAIQRDVDAERAGHRPQVRHRKNQ